MAERAATLGRRLVEKRKARDDLREALKTAEKDHKDAEERMWDYLDDEDQDTGLWNLGPPHGRYQFVKQETIKAVVKDPERAVADIRAQHLEKALLDEAQGIRQKPLTDDLKHRIREGIPFIDGVDVHFTRYVTTTKKKERTR